MFVVLTVRTLLILGFRKIEENTFRRRVACAVAFLVCAVASIAGQFYFGEPIRPVTLLPLVGVGLGCLGEASNNMIVRRRCVLAMGCTMAAFGLAMEAWGLVFKNLVSDVGATIYSINRYRDPPLPALAARARHGVVKAKSYPHAGCRKSPVRCDERGVETELGPNR